MQKIKLDDFWFPDETTESGTFFKLLVHRLSKAGSEFDAIIKVSEERAHKPKLRMVHRASGIQCSLHIAAPDLVKSSTVIAEIIEFKPIGTSSFTSYVLSRNFHSLTIH